MSARARTVREALRDIVLGDDCHAAAAARRLAGEALWPTAVALSGQWRVTPVVFQRMARLGVGVDEATVVRLREMTFAAGAHGALAVRRSCDVLATLERAGVEAVAIKGIALVASLYGRRPLRMVGDLDLVVREGAYAAARAALEPAGYVDAYIPLDRHLADIALSPHLHNVARTLRGADFEVDVHWQFGSAPPPALRTARIIERARRMSLAGTPIRVTAAADAMVITAHHALRGYFSPFEVAKDAHDLAAWWTLRSDAWTLDDVIVTAQEADVATTLYALWQLVVRRHAAHPAQAGVAALGEALGRRARCEGEQLADFCEEQFNAGARAERTVQLFDAARLGRVVAGHAKRIVSGSYAPADVIRTPRKPLPARLVHATCRVVRVVRELCRLPAYPRYRAVARAQSRHHSSSRSV